MQVDAKLRDEVVDWVEYWADRAEFSRGSFVDGLGISRSKFYDWRKRRGKENRHNGQVPRGHWLEAWEKDEICRFYQANELEGYRRCAYMMLDQDLVAASPSTVYRVLCQAGLMRQRNCEKTSQFGSGFEQPKAAHEHWHVDVSYLNLSGTFYYFCGVLDGYSRFVVHWEIRESMTEADVEVILQRARERCPGQSPRIISDNGPQFIAKEFKEFIRVSGMTHVRTSPYYPQSNGKVERFHATLKQECIRPKTPLTLADASVS